MCKPKRSDKLSLEIEELEFELRYKIWPTIQGYIREKALGRAHRRYVGTGKPNSEESPCEGFGVLFAI
jgi:hypothetical protein